MPPDRHVQVRLGGISSTTFDPESEGPDHPAGIGRKKVLADSMDQYVPRKNRPDPLQRGGPTLIVLLRGSAHPVFPVPHLRGKPVLIVISSAVPQTTSNRTT